MNWKSLAVLFLTVFLLASCSPQRRLHRLLTKHPELTRIDTIKIQDTVIVPGIKTDTVFHSSALKDTVIITKENLQIQLVEINDTVYLDAKVEADTIILSKEIFVDRIINVKREALWIEYWWVWLALFGCMVLLIKRQ